MTKTIIFSILIFVLDQASKWIVVGYLNLRTVRAIDVLPPFLNLRMAWNEGINFGLFSGFGSDILRWSLIVIALVVAACVFWWGRKINGWFGSFLLGSIIGGALGNTVDRILYGAVADFLNMSCCGLNNPYSFNIADIAIFVGAAGLVLFSERLQRRA